MSGMTKSTPKSSDSGNIMPASRTMMSSPSRSTIMFMPNSPSPPRGMAVRDRAVLWALFSEALLKETLTPQLKQASYHTKVTGDCDSGQVRMQERLRVSPVVVGSCVGSGIHGQESWILLMGVASEKVGDRNENYGADGRGGERIPAAAAEDSQLGENPAADEGAH